MFDHTIEEPAISDGRKHRGWRSVKWGLLTTFVAVLVVVPYLYYRLDEEIKLRVEDKLGSHYPKLMVNVRSARLVQGEGIEVRGLSLRMPGVPLPQGELVYVEEMFLECSTDVRDLLGDKLDIGRMVVRRMTLRATRGTDGAWSSSQLLPLPSFSKHPPPAIIEDGIIEIRDLQKQPASTLVLRDANLKITDISDPLTLSDAPHTLQVAGQFTNEHLRRVEVQGTIDSKGESWSATGKIQGAQITPDLRNCIPGECPKQLIELQAVRATADAQFRVHYNRLQNPALDYEISGKITGGRVDDPRLPYPLTNLQATFVSNRHGQALQNLTAQSGASTMQLDLRRSGTVDNSPIQLVFHGRQLLLDRKFLDMLPAKLQEDWQKFMPTGEIDLDMQLDFDGHTWRPQITTTCHNVSFAYHKFPYRMQHGRGWIQLSGTHLKLDMVTSTDGSECHITGDWNTGVAPPAGWVKVEGKHLRFDNKLIAALPERSRGVVASLQPSGTFDIDWFTSRTAEPGAKDHNVAVVKLNRCAMKSDKFPYPLSDVTGTLEMQDQNWTFRDLAALNDTGRVTSKGTFGPTPDGNELVMEFDARGITLEDELRDALSAGAQQLWRDLKPRGTVDLQAQLRYKSAEAKTHLWVAVQPCEDSVSIEPAAFPYRLDALRGVMVYQDGQVTLDRLRAVHGRTTISTRGHGGMRPDGGWELRLENLAIDRVTADHDLLQALPGKLKKVVADLRPTGPFNMRGSLGLASVRQPDPVLTSDWNLEFDLLQNTLDCGVLLENVNGGLRLFGTYDGKAFKSRGELAVDSLTYRNWQFTEIMGPIWIDDTRVLLGFWADRMHGDQRERRITGKLYGGTVIADGWVSLVPETRYQIQAQLADGDLQRWTQEAMAGRQQLSGKLFGNLELRGKGGSMNDLAGQGVLQLRDADIYKVPIMVQMLSVLGLRPPKETAFDKGDINFRIVGEHIYVDRVDFNGNAISLLGKGEIGFDGKMRLSFHPVLGRDDVRVPLISNLLGGVSQQVMLIHAEGTMQEPVMRREAFPNVQQALQQLQLEFQPRVGNVPAQPTQGVER